MERKLVALVSAIVLVLAACASSKSGEMEPRYVAVHNALAALGMSQVGPLHQGSLAEGREARVRVELPPQCTTVVALGSAGVRDIDVQVLDRTTSRLHTTRRRTRRPSSARAPKRAVASRSSSR